MQSNNCMQLCIESRVAKNYFWRPCYLRPACPFNGILISYLFLVSKVCLYNLGAFKTKYWFCLLASRSKGMIEIQCRYHSFSRKTSKRTHIPFSVCAERLILEIKSAPDRSAIKRIRHVLSVWSRSEVYEVNPVEKFDAHKTCYESCILCGRETAVSKELTIAQRYGYIEGSGQLCKNCYDSL